MAAELERENARKSCRAFRGAGEGDAAPALEALLATLQAQELHSKILAISWNLGDFLAISRNLGDFLAKNRQELLFRQGLVRACMILASKKASFRFFSFRQGSWRCARNLGGPQDLGIYL